MKNFGDKMKAADAGIDISGLLDGIVASFMDSDNEMANRILKNDPQWDRLQREKEIYEGILDNYGGMTEISFNLSEIGESLRYMYGNACYLAGIREGISFILWAAGYKFADAGKIRL